MSLGVSYSRIVFIALCLLIPEQVTCLGANIKPWHQRHTVEGTAIIGSIGDTVVSDTHRPQQRRYIRHAEAPTTLQTSRVTTQLQQEYPFYHTSDELNAEVMSLASSCDGALSVRTLQDNGTSIDVVTVKKPDAKPLNRVFMLFGEHSRELISPETGLFFLQALCGKAKLSSSTSSETSVASVLKDNEFEIVLNGNPHSRRQVEQGRYCLRTNPNGVDLNRNWDEKWEGGSDMFGGESNPGPKPFSEPETRIFKRLVTEFQPTTFLTVHSGTRGMYIPWAYDQKHLASCNRDSMMEVLRSIDREHCQCPYGAAGKEVGYSCPGTCLDYAYGVLDTPYAFAFEIYSSPDVDEDLKRRWEEKMKSGGEALVQSGSHLGHAHFIDFFDDYASDFIDTSSSSKDIVLASGSYSSLEADQAFLQAKAACFKFFNPVTEERFNQTVSNWVAAYIQMSAMVAQKIKSSQGASIL